ncbi:hypothetical protein Pmani_025343 [Petrolisthes manimaculis]|uniref:Tudor domain-containing protein n=1 Tax=Petrolisthes manimaculis TaxID=1843537 RepID=A0AAE1P6X7_9EUCA|nr:hypothetical protein Pmani_025343 [Petrolisthes manimaculis]
MDGVDVLVVGLDVVGQQVVLIATDILDKKTATARNNLVHGLLRSSKTIPAFNLVQRGYSGIVVVDLPTSAGQQLYRARVTDWRYQHSGLVDVLLVDEGETNVKVSVDNLKPCPNSVSEAKYPAIYKRFIVADLNPINKDCGLDFVSKLINKRVKLLLHDRMKDMAHVSLVDLAKYFPDCDRARPQNPYTNFSMTPGVYEPCTIQKVFNGPWNFLLQFASQKIKREKLSAELRCLVQGRDVTKIKPKENDPVIIKAYKELCRGLVMNKTAIGELNIYCVDTGRMVQRPVNDEFWMVPKNLMQYPTLIQKCCLSSLPDTFSKELCERFATIVDKQNMLGIVDKEFEDPIHVSLYIDGLSVLTMITTCKYEKLDLPWKCQAFISFVSEEEGLIYLQLAENVDAIMKMLDDLQSIPGDNKVKKIQTGCPCLAIFTEDSLWYRAILLSEGRHYTVQYVDYGNQGSLKKGQAALDGTEKVEVVVVGEVEREGKKVPLVKLNTDCIKTTTTTTILPTYSTSSITQVVGQNVGNQKAPHQPPPALKDPCITRRPPLLSDPEATTFVHPVTTETFSVVPTKDFPPNTLTCNDLIATLPRTATSLPTVATTFHPYTNNLLSISTPSPPFYTSPPPILPHKSGVHWKNDMSSERVITTTTELPQIALHPGTKHLCKIVSMSATSCLFHAALLENEEIAKMLKEQLNSMAVTEGNLIKNPQLGMVVAVFVHGRWHRARISAYHAPNITLFMVDEGNQIHMPMFEILMCLLPSELSKYPGQVVSCFPENGIGTGEAEATRDWLIHLATTKATVILEFLACASDSSTWKVQVSEYIPMKSTPDHPSQNVPAVNPCQTTSQLSVSKLSKFPVAKKDEVVYQKQKEKEMQVVDRSPDEVGSKADLVTNWRKPNQPTSAENITQKPSDINWRIHNTKDKEPGYPIVPKVQNTVGPMRHPLRSGAKADHPSRIERQGQARKYNHPQEKVQSKGVPELSPPGTSQDRETNVLPDNNVNAINCLLNQSQDIASAICWSPSDSDNNVTAMCSLLNQAKEMVSVICRTPDPADCLQPQQESVKIKTKDLSPVLKPYLESFSNDTPLTDTQMKDIPLTTPDDNIEVEYPITVLPLNKPLDIKVARVLSPSMFICKVLSAWTPALKEIMAIAQDDYNRWLNCSQTIPYARGEQAVMVLDKFDQKWHRGRVLQLPEGPHVELVDEGSLRTIFSISSVLPLRPAYANFPPAAITISIPNFLPSCISWTEDVEAVSKQLLLRAVQCVIRRKDNKDSQLWEADQIYLNRISFTEVLLDACLAVKWKPIPGLHHTENGKEKKDADDVHLKVRTTEMSLPKSFTTLVPMALKTDGSTQYGVEKSWCGPRPPTPIPRTRVSKAWKDQNKEQVLEVIEGKALSTDTNERISGFANGTLSIPKEPSVVTSLIPISSEQPIFTMLEKTKNSLSLSTPQSSDINIGCNGSWSFGDVCRKELQFTPDVSIIASHSTVSTVKTVRDSDSVASESQLKVVEDGTEISTSTSIPVKQLVVSSKETQKGSVKTNEDCKENANLGPQCTSESPPMTPPQQLGSPVMEEDQKMPGESGESKSLLLQIPEDCGKFLCNKKGMHPSEEHHTYMAAPMHSPTIKQMDCPFDEVRQATGITMEYQTRATSELEKCEEPKATDVMFENGTIEIEMLEATQACIMSKGQDMSESEGVTGMEVLEKAAATGIVGLKEGVVTIVELPEDRAAANGLQMSGGGVATGVWTLQEATTGVEQSQEAATSMKVLEGGGRCVEILEETVASGKKMFGGKTVACVEVADAEAAAVEVAKEIAVTGMDIMEDTYSLLHYSTQLSSAVIQSATQELSSGTIYCGRREKHASSGSSLLLKNACFAIQGSQENHCDTSMLSPVLGRNDNVSSELTEGHGSDESFITVQNAVEQEKKQKLDVDNLVQSVEESSKEYHEASLLASSSMVSQDKEGKLLTYRHRICHDSQKKPEECNLDQQVTDISSQSSKFLNLKQNQSDNFGGLLSTEHCSHLEGLENHSDSFSQEGKGKLDNVEPTVTIRSPPGDKKMSRDEEGVMKNILPYEFVSCSDAQLAVINNECGVIRDSEVPELNESVSLNFRMEYAINTDLNEDYGCTPMLQVTQGDIKKDDREDTDLHEREANQELICESTVKVVVKPSYEDLTVGKQDGFAVSGKNLVTEYFEDAVITNHQNGIDSNTESTNASLLNTSEVVEHMEFFSGMPGTSITSNSPNEVSLIEFDDLCLQEEVAVMYDVAKEDKTAKISRTKLESNIVDEVETMDRNEANYCCQTQPSFQNIDSSLEEENKIAQDKEIGHTQAEESMLHVSGLAEQRLLEGGEGVYISYCEKNQVWLQRSQDTVNLDTLHTRVQELAPTLTPMKNPVGGSLCLAQGEEEEVWYRAVVEPQTTTTDGAGTNVFFMDYGNCSYAVWNKIIEMPASLLSVEPLSYCCLLETQSGTSLDQLLQDYIDKELNVVYNEDGEFITLEYCGTNIFGEVGSLQVVYNPQRQARDMELQVGLQKEATKVGATNVYGNVVTDKEDSNETNNDLHSGVGYVLLALRSKTQKAGEVLEIKSKEDSTKEHNEQISAEVETEVGTCLQQSIAGTRNKADIEGTEKKVLETETISNHIRGAMMCDVEINYMNQRVPGRPELYAIKEECEEADIHSEKPQLNIYTALLVHIKDAPFCLWMQRQEDLDLAEYVQMRLEELCPEDMQPVKQPKIDQVCISLYNGSRQRVAITSITGEKVNVQFIDHGRYGSVSHTNLWELEDDLADIKPLIFQALLPAKIITGKESGAVLAVAEAALSQTCVCLDLDHLTPLRTSLHTLVWTSGTGDLADLLVSNGLATPMSWEQEVGQYLAAQVKKAMQSSVASLQQK